MSGRYISKKLRDAIIHRANGRCEYCKSLMKNAIHTFHIDHILPLIDEGPSDFENLALSCGGCNSAKWIRNQSKDPVTNKETPLFNPRKDRWNEHFYWSDDYLEVIGITPKGRATIVALKLNRAGLINIRRLTKLTGEHPPDMI